MGKQPAEQNNIWNMHRGCSTEFSPIKVFPSSFSPRPPYCCSLSRTSRAQWTSALMKNLEFSMKELRPSYSYTYIRQLHPSALLSIYTSQRTLLPFFHTMSRTLYRIIPTGRYNKKKEDEKAQLELKNEQTCLTHLRREKKTFWKGVTLYFFTEIRASNKTHVDFKYIHLSKKNAYISKECHAFQKNAKKETNITVIL